MDELAALLPPLPHVVWTMIATAVSVVIGGLIGLVLQRLTGWRWATVGAIILANAIGYSSANLIADAQAGSREAKELVANLAGNEPLKTIIRLEPPVRAELERGLVRAMARGSSEQKVAASRKVAGDIVNTRVSKAYTKAGSAELHRTVAAELAALRALEGRPAQCVDVFLGRGLPSIDSIDAKIGAEMLASKGAVIESAVLRPETLAAPLSSNEIMALLTKAAAADGGDFSSVIDLDKVATLPPAKGCRIAILFETLVVGLEQQEAAAILKTIQMLAATPPL